MPSVVDVVLWWNGISLVTGVVRLSMVVVLLESMLRIWRLECVLLVVSIDVMVMVWRGFFLVSYKG